MNIKKYILNILNILIKPFYWTWIWKYPFFKQMFFLYEFLYKNLKSNWEILINTKYNTKMYVSTNWDFVEKDLIIKWVWEKYITNIIINNINIWDTFVDLWTNIWYYSLIVSKKVWGKWQVISFEPAKENIDKLKKNIKVNELTNIKLYEC